MLSEPVQWQDFRTFEKAYFERGRDAEPNFPTMLSKGALKMRI